MTELKPRYDRIPEPRQLRADEILVRWSNGKDTGSQWLLYRDARTDIKLLNETYGRENWQRLHKEVNGSSNCGVAIWCHEKKCWVEKWDAGSESQIDPDKGEASSSFKRANVNWNIAIELYTDLFIWIKSDLIPTKKNSNGKYAIDSYSKPVVSYVEYANGFITKLAIDFEGKTVFKFPRSAKIPSDKPGKVTPPPLDLADDEDGNEEESTGAPDVHPGNPNELPRKKISDVTEPGIIKLLKVVAKKDFDPTAEFEFTTVRWLMPKEYDWLIGRDDYEDLQLVFDHFINTDGLGIGKEKKAELKKKLEELKPTESGEESSADDEELDDLPF